MKQPDIVMVDSRWLVRPSEIVRLAAILIVCASLFGWLLGNTAQIIGGQISGIVAMASALAIILYQRSRQS